MRAKSKAPVEKSPVCVRRIGRVENGWTYCGRQSDIYDQSDWTFTDPNHAVLSLSTGTMLEGRTLVICPDCKKVIVSALSGKTVPKVNLEKTESPDE